MWPMPDRRAEQNRELRRENGKLLDIVVATLGVGSGTDPHKGPPADLTGHAIEILQAIGKASDDLHVAHYIRLGRQYRLTFATIARLLDRDEDDVHGILRRADGA